MLALYLLWGIERAMPVMLFAMYLVTAFRICRYSSWRAAGAPNPFLPRRVGIAVAKYERRMRFAA